MLVSLSRKCSSFQRMIILIKVYRYTFLSLSVYANLVAFYTKITFLKSKLGQSITMISNHVQNVKHLFNKFTQWKATSITSSNKKPSTSNLTFTTKKINSSFVLILNIFSTLAAFKPIHSLLLIKYKNSSWPTTTKLSLSPMNSSKSPLADSLISHLTESKKSHWHPCKIQSKSLMPSFKLKSPKTTTFIWCSFRFWVRLTVLKRNWLDKSKKTLNLKQISQIKGQASTPWLKNLPILKTSPSKLWMQKWVK